jgi:hypothetical protein
VDKVWGLGFGLPLAPIILGVVTAIGGGLIRDVLAGRQTLLMTSELYATPVLFGCTLYVVLLHLIPEYRFISAVGCCLFIFGIRAAAIHWQLSVPNWLITKVRTERWGGKKGGLGEHEKLKVVVASPGFACSPYSESHPDGFRPTSLYQKVSVSIVAVPL